MSSDLTTIKIKSLATHPRISNKSRSICCFNIINNAISY
ncbi:hypothetical protein ECDEC6E_1696 [Escherichia coli DEC6E]|nr:hypothetical protein ECDEC6D_1761 [Escherichia coli DEC6D]EHV75708.1 hypothetical protein ECDEC6E_1696 [Escherichia coli DEC6E]